MTHVYDDDGRFLPVTVVRAGPCYVTQLKDLARDGYQAVQIGFEETREELISGAEQGHLGSLPALRHLREYRTEDSELSVGDEITVDSFEVGQRLTVSGTSKGKGFAGVMKRHGFRGGPRTHGQSDRERAPGSIGAGNTPGRVFKGTRMAGRLGGGRVTRKKVEIVRIDADKNVLLLKGAVPGHSGGLVMLNEERGN
tara:strand:+ start:163 stop:753 length:591 start_codon:yes stop_codon:yes gene_type:complete